MKIKTEKQELEEKEFWELEELLEGTEYDKTDLILMYSNALMGTFSNNIEKKISEIFEKWISTTKVQNFIESYFKKKYLINKIKELDIFEKEEYRTILLDFINWKYERIYVSSPLDKNFIVDVSSIDLLIDIIEQYIEAYNMKRNIWTDFYKMIVNLEWTWNEYNPVVPSIFRVIIW